MRKSGFTLVELLVIIGIMAAMVTMSVISVRSGQDAFRLKGATRDILAKVRYARSVALVSRNSVKVVFSNSSVEDETAAKIVVKPLEDGFISERVPTNIITLSGKPLPGSAGKLESNFEDNTDPEAESGSSIISMLKPEIDEMLVKGIKVKVVCEEKALMAERSAAQKRSRMSVSGNNLAITELVDKEETAMANGRSTENDVVGGEINEVVWGSLGTTDAHTIYVYREGTDYLDGYKIHVDEMGGVKVE